MIQQSLYLPPASKNIDPVTSFIAEARINKSGQRVTQAQKVLAALKQYPLCTSAELAQRMGVDRYMVARRLPDLLHNHLVRQCMSRVCTVTRSESVTWEAA